MPVGERKDLVNLKEKDAFQSGRKLVAIISTVASSGISLHAERGRAANVRRRVHVTLDPPWSSDFLMQQTGRTNRSNQVVEPRYVFAASDLQGDKRFASIVASRMESMGAICNGDRRATGASARLAAEASMPVATTDTRIAPSMLVSSVEPTMMLASGSTFSRMMFAASSNSNRVRS